MASVKNCPFCDIAARAPARFNRAVLSQYQRKRRRANGADADADANADASTPAPPLLALPAPSAARLVYADRRVVAFVDRSPAAQQHLLVCPRAHVPNVNTLYEDQGRRLPLAAPTPGDAEDDDGDADDNSITPADLADHMRRVGEALLWQRSSSYAASEGRRKNDAVAATATAADAADNDDANRGPSFLFGYHVPPWRSVDHLHLHCIEPPFAPPALEVKYQLEWLNWLPDERLRARLRDGGGYGGGEGGGPAWCCCWPLRRQGQRAGSGSREPLVPPPP